MMLLVGFVLTHQQKEKEDLDDISNELELADEDDKIPYAYIPLLVS
jgi:hypothetical protein